MGGPTRIPLTLALEGQGGAVHARVLNEFDQEIRARRRAFAQPLQIQERSQSAEEIAAKIAAGSRWILDESAQRLRLGEWMAQETLGSKDEQAELFERVSPRRGFAQTALDVEVELRVRADADATALLGLPWTELAFHGHYLRRHPGWTIAVSSMAERKGVVRLLRPARILVAALEQDAALGGAEHVEELRERLGDLDPGFKSQSWLRVARTWAEVELELEERPPSVFYFYGHGALHQDLFELQLDDDWRAVDRLAGLVRQSGALQLVYLNACVSGAGGSRSGAHQLLPFVPCVVVNTPKAPVPEARAIALDFFARIFGKSEPPPRAAMAAAALVEPTHERWLCPVSWERYERWECEYAPFGAHLELEVVLDSLDRSAQKSRVRELVTEMTAGQLGEVRVLSCHYAARAGNRVDRFSQDLVIQLQNPAPAATRVISLGRLLLPEEPSLFARSIPDQLNQRLAHGRRLVEKAGDHGQPGSRFLFVFDWGVLGRDDRPPLTDEQYFEAHDALMDGIKGLLRDERGRWRDGFFALSLMANDRPALDVVEWMGALHRELDDRDNATDHAHILDELGDAPRPEISLWLKKNKLRLGIDVPLEELAKGIHSKTKGRYEETVLLLQSHTAGWSSLQRRLRKEGHIR